MSIAAPPKEGEANKELIDFLAGVLKVKKTDIDLDKGSKSKSKMIVVNGISAKTAYLYIKENLE